jgi:hypothetical protein
MIPGSCFFGAFLIEVMPPSPGLGAGLPVLNTCSICLFNKSLISPNSRFAKS